MDGYDRYNALGLRSNIVLVGCMAHERRKFDEAVKAQGVALSLLSSDQG